MNTPSHLAPEYRRSGIGASEIGAILGVNRFKTPLDVYAEKLGLKEATPDNPALRWGRILEPAIASAYEEFHGVELSECAHRVKEFDGCRFLMTPDRLSEDEALIVEIKTAGLWSAKDWGASGEDGAPLSYAAQLALYLWGAGMATGVIAALIAGQDYREYPQTRDAELEEAILAAGAKFWRDNVLAKKPPEAANLADESRWIERRYRANLSEAVAIADPFTAEKMEALSVLRGRIKELGMEEEALENLLKLAVGDGSGLSSGAYLVSWKLSTPSKPKPPKELNLAALARDLGITELELSGLLSKHTAERPGSRRFLLKPVKDLNR